jgi:hypothetical protein
MLLTNLAPTLTVPGKEMYNSLVLLILHLRIKLMIAAKSEPVDKTFYTIVDRSKERWTALFLHCRAGKSLSFVRNMNILRKT